LARKGAGWFEDLAPPFRFLAIDRRIGWPSPHIDEFGLGHLFEGRKGAALFTSSSARLIARVIGAAPDVDTLISYSQLGAFAFSATPYAGVRKLLPPDPWAKQYAHSNSSRPRQDLQHDVEASFRAAVQAMLAAAPDAALELSGGLDSRLILAAMTREQRTGRKALTLGSPGKISQDQLIAGEIASQYTLFHQISQPTAKPWEEADSLFRTLDQACDGYQGMGNPVDKATLLANGEDDEGLLRFSGQNGEILRGFYHAMQPLALPASENLWSNLLDWRLIANDRVPPRFLAADCRENALPAARAAILAELANFDGEWGQVIDRLYLRLRMQAWVGNASSSNLVKRTMLMPFFDREFVRAALALPASQRSKSHAAYRLLIDIDPALAAMPLDSGTSPANLLNPSVATKLADLRRNVGKLARKLEQRVRPQSGAALGSAAVIEAWHHHRGYDRLNFGRLETLGIFDPAKLAAVQAGQLTPDRNELGFLLICDSL
jgi:asparagine synthase (glutamine-hydrolysing)